VRTVGSNGARTMEAIREAGLGLIFEHGYEAMTLRQLATEVGLQQGSLYNHFRTKQELLFKLIMHHMENLLAELDTALSGIADPVERLSAFVGFHVRYHITRRREVFISYSELRSLEPENYNAIVALRGRYEDVLTGIISDGVAAGTIRTADARIAAFGLIAMLSGIVNWYQPKGRRTADEIAAIYKEMAFCGLVVDKRAA
jgi:AcrR family transcriptional regulator